MTTRVFKSSIITSGEPVFHDREALKFISSNAADQSVLLTVMEVHSDLVGELVELKQRTGNDKLRITFGIFEQANAMNDAGERMQGRMCVLMLVNLGIPASPKSIINSAGVFLEIEGDRIVNAHPVDQMSTAPLNIPVPGNSTIN